jgi:hypothetical protein
VAICDQGARTGAVTLCVSSCWVGDRLLPIANACINSFGARGFAFRLYTYATVDDVPRFVEYGDASALVPQDGIFVAHGGLETFADLLAYRFLERVGGWWVDNDVVSNSARLPDVSIAYAEERPGIINNAVLKFPPKHPAIDDLLRHIAGINPTEGAWGATGPLALSAIFPKHPLSQYQCATTDFYPIHWREAPKLLFPEYTAEIVARTTHSPLIHLWGAALREVGFDFRRWAPPPHSFLESIYEKYLDRNIAQRLEPIDEALFRQHVQSYVARHWGVTLSLV